MRVILKCVFMFSVFFSALAEACPNLNGAYNCVAVDDDYNIPLSIQQKNNHFIFLSQSTEKNIIADNTQRKVHAPGYTDRTEQAWCETNSLNIKNIGRALKKEGGYYGTETSLTTLTTKDFGLDYTEIATLVTNNGEKYYYNMTFYCYKN